PLRLRPETEQELATQLWRQESDWQELCQIESEYRLVRQTLDLMQLGGAAALPTEEISQVLEQGLSSFDSNQENQSYLWQRMGELLLLWRSWCLERGFLTYGLIYELYWRYLLPDTQYQYHLQNRYQAVFADDLDDYPAIARELLEVLLDHGAKGVFTFNPDGKIRLGLNADPDYLEGLRTRCQQIQLTTAAPSIATEFAETAVSLVQESAFLVNAPATVQCLQTISRAALLRQTAEIIIQAVKHQGIDPSEIAIIAPGLDEIARYSFIEILSAQGISVNPLNEQRSLISSPLVRSLLTLMGLIYPDLGRLIDREAIAEMLTVLSHSQESNPDSVPQIDPVRAGLIADYCYHAAAASPDLKPVETFPRWDRLGHQATAAYQKIVSWIEASKLKQQRSITPTILLSEAIAHFFNQGNRLSREKLSLLRELMETAQHFWEVERRLRQHEPREQTPSQTVAQFIQLLQRGTITANPRPLRQFTPVTGAVTLSTVFQYRSLRSSHDWQFWLDASSPLWAQGGAATLLGAPLFLKQWGGEAWQPEQEYTMDQERLARILRDVLARATAKVFLCHSDLGVNGTEQAGALLPLVHAATQYSPTNLSSDSVYESAY
ncbi:MAG: recombinase family protein, partial [Cyanobacteria bacterium J06558_2]